MTRRFIVPEVVQTSALDCGPASLKSLLDGFGIPVSYGRLREACQTDVDGTSIDTMEDVARQLGLQAEQVMLPRDHALLDESASLPAIIVVRLPGGAMHFLVAWRRHGPFVQVMDPGRGRRWLSCERLLDDLHVHVMPVDAGEWREWAGSPNFVRPLERRLGRIGVAAVASRRLIEGALADPGWRVIAALDAATRMTTTLVDSGALGRGRTASAVLERLLERARVDEGGEAETVPEDCWSVRPCAPGGDGRERILFRGTVLVRALGLRDVGGVEAAESAPDGEPALSPELAAALAEPPSRPGRELLRALRADGLLTPLAVAVAISVAAAAVIFQALLLRGLLDIGRELALPGQRLAAMVALFALMVALAVMNLPIAAEVQRMGRRLEMRFRLAFLEKIPRLGDRFFRSRLTSDMAERCHGIQNLRMVPALGFQLVRSVWSLGFTVAGVIWLDPGSAPLEPAGAGGHPEGVGGGPAGEGGERAIAAGAREAWLICRLSEALASGAHEIGLSAADLAALEGRDPPPPPPDAFAVVATIAAASDEALDAGRFRVLVHACSGPSGAVLLGRFCHLDDDLRSHVERHLRAEEALRPDAVFAEIVHIPEGRLGNVLCRPVLRAFEIPYLGRSGAEEDRQIPLSDLRVSVEGDRVVLRSGRLGREVLPRLTSAHSHALSSLAIYRFLCALQAQDGARGGNWSWGRLEAAPFLPRVTAGRLVLSLARWRLVRADLEPLGRATRGAARFRAVREMRERRRLPRCLALVDGDHVLPVDLENALSVETFARLVGRRATASLVEIFPEPDEQCARGPEGRFVHEIVVPFERRPGAAAVPAPARRRLAASGAPAPRSFPPGSEWLYAKIYTGTATADHLLRTVVGPLAAEAVRSGAADRWFFIRYGDPDWHIRLRLRGEPGRLLGEVLPALRAALAAPLADRRAWRLQLDTYEREVERYGGADGVDLAERLFDADSDAVLALLDGLDGDAGADQRWRLALAGMHALLDDLAIDPPARLALLEGLRASYGREHRMSKQVESRLGSRFHREREGLAALLGASPAHPPAASGATGALAAGIAVLRARSARIAPIASALRDLERAGRLGVPLIEIAGSFLHLHANRVLRAAVRAQELVLYDFLARLASPPPPRRRT